jgi:GNAT superfamily N-acetyltransferase
MDVSCRWRADFADGDVDALHAVAFGHPPRRTEWRAQVERHSLGWVCAYDRDTLVGFVNVAWDGGAHAFVLDTLVAAAQRHRGVGSALVVVAAQEARDAGCQWLHVDFEPELGDFYLRSCGFSPSAAGILALA